MTGSTVHWLTRTCLTVPGVVLLALTGTACQRGGPSHPPPLEDPGPIDTPDTIPGDGTGETGDDLPPPPDGWNQLRLHSISPTHGPAVGGTPVVLQGNGFSGALAVTFGGRQVDPVDVEILDPHRVRVLTPAGEVGPATVEITKGSDSLSLPDGYSYDAFFIEPSSGSVGGGLRVEIRGTGTQFDAADIVTFGNARATSVIVASESLIQCTVPSGEEGFVDVTVSGPTGEWTLEDGFQYFNSADPFGGGLGGGPIAGAIDVTVLDWITLIPVAEANILLERVGGELETFLTDENGQVTIAEEGLSGVQRLTATKLGYGSSSFVDFDARAVTIFLMPIPDPQPGAGGGRPERLASEIDGQLIFYSEVEFGPGPWRIVPDPVGPDEVKVSYVFTTKANVWSSDVDPGDGGIVTEDDAAERGFAYDIVARPGGYAVWAIAGLQDTSTQTFVPYAMGVTRNVIAGPGDIVEDVDIEMTIPLDQQIEVNLVDPPARGPFGPDVFGVDAFISLGGEGVIPRYDVLERESTGRVTFRVPWMAPFEGNLADASYTLMGGAWTGQDEVQPYSMVVSGAHRSIHEPIEVGPFNCVPTFVRPVFGGALDGDREIEWGCDGQEPEFFYMEMWQGMTPVWSLFADGSSRVFTLPDIAEITGGDALAGDATWSVYAITVPGATFDEVSYRHLRSVAWERVAYDSSQFQF